MRTLIPRAAGSPAALRRSAARLIAGVAAAVLVAGLVGCGGPPDRRAEADRLQTAIDAMPGVKVAHVNYAHSWDSALLDIDVSVPDATPQQIADVVKRINTIRGDAFNGYDQSAEFEVMADKRGTIRRDAELDPDSIAADTTQVRRLASAVTGTVSLARGDKTGTYLGLGGVSTPIDDTLAAVRAEFGDSIPKVDIQPPSGGFGTVGAPKWTVMFPFSADDQRRIDQQLSAIPLGVTDIEVGPGAVFTKLVVEVSNPANADADLAATIEATRAGPAHPMWLMFHLSDAQKPTDWPGSVDVGGCSYANSGYTDSEKENHPEKFLSAQTVALQQRLRSRFDTCRH
ncbi:hypothetical protein [Mycobacterium branderi]|uniref:Lipoprotein n=1 Tax=Mycobacterium branderi TaxID=43348 RepID=A0A7I7WFI5_9MYCO|nr:hypothetical protein [Mycobacterium branderi]MCV7236374.1 hypothetical protein [Mycobacterium branderi]ORA32554.1 hypothetical protein BST20_24420 [Mycobacterium branderi]BBZ15263.1 hypothetical protein MBRA_54580 [Mycobacterium branderi]